MLSSWGKFFYDDSELGTDLKFEKLRIWRTSGIIKDYRMVVI